jgi:hypothetical protein
MGVDTLLLLLASYGMLCGSELYIAFLLCGKYLFSQETENEKRKSNESPEGNKHFTGSM